MGITLTLIQMIYKYIVDGWQYYEVYQQLQSGHFTGWCLHPDHPVIVSLLLEHPVQYLEQSAAADIVCSEEIVWRE